MKKKYILIIVFFITSSVFGLKLDRVILAVNMNQDYLPFWPIAARAWKKIVGIRPTLALIAPPEIQIDDSIGDVVRFDPIPGVPTAFHAQVIRLFLPALFPDDVCITSDIDLIPLSS